MKDVIHPIPTLQELLVSISRLLDPSKCPIWDPYSLRSHCLQAFSRKPSISTSLLLCTFSKSWLYTTPIDFLTERRNQMKDLIPSSTQSPSRRNTAFVFRKAFAERLLSFWIYKKIPSQRTQNFKSSSIGFLGNNGRPPPPPGAPGIHSLLQNCCMQQSWV